MCATKCEAARVRLHARGRVMMYHCEQERLLQIERPSSHPTPPNTQGCSPPTHPTPPHLTRRDAPHPHIPPRLTCRDASHPHTPPQPTWLIARHSSAILSTPRGAAERGSATAGDDSPAASCAKASDPSASGSWGPTPREPHRWAAQERGAGDRSSSSSSSSSNCFARLRLHNTRCAMSSGPGTALRRRRCRHIAAPHIFVDKGLRQVQNAEVDQSVPDDAGIQEAARTAPRQIRHQAVTRRGHHHRHVRHNLRCGAVGWSGVGYGAAMWGGVHRAACAVR